MKPSEWVDGWYHTYKGEGYSEKGDKEALAKIVALLEAVEMTDLSGAVSLSLFCVSEGSATMMDVSHILKAALALKEV
jgi:hypothetical protein